MAAEKRSSIADLCSEIQDLTPLGLGSETWYLIIAAILSTSPEPSLLADLWTHLTSTPTFNLPPSQTHLSLRLRDLLLKLVTLIGAPQVLSALIPLAAAQHPSPTSLTTSAQTSTLSPQWQNIDIPSTHARGTATINTIYGPTLLPQIFNSFGSHSADIQFMELFTVYGLYLSDHSVLTPLETETVVFVTIMCQGLRGPCLWHLRGLGRLLGARGTDEDGESMAKIKDVLRAVKVCSMRVVEWVGEDFVGRSGMESKQGWPNVGDVGRELGGWGDDAWEGAVERGLGETEGGK